MCEAVSSLFRDRLNRLRSGEAAAIEEFVATYEPFIRRTIRFRINRAALSPAADSVDVCQSVLGSFLVRLIAGDYALESEGDLRKLLFAIANKKFLVLQRREAAAKRDRRQTQSIEQCAEIADHRQSDPARSMVGAELLQQVKSRLSVPEQRLFELRSSGVSWNHIAEELVEDVALLRKRFSRAIRRVAVDLGLEDSDV